ncbi:hypothetical protein FRC07_003568 [Ceratobasidium sp. 392]|nr:hypothetical protein FRC07_003568 [Ceratobasidium sp. 392]
MLGGVRQYLRDFFGSPPKANDTDTYRRDWQARQTVDQAQLATQRLEEIIGPLSEHTPMTVQRLHSSPNPSFGSSMNLHSTAPPTASVDTASSSVVTLPATNPSHVNAASGSTTTLTPPASQQIHQPPGTVPMRSAFDFQKSFNQAIGVMGRTKGLKYDVQSLSERCGALNEMLNDLPPELKSSPKFSYEFTKMGQELEDIVLFLNDFNRKGALKQAAARKGMHLQVARLANDFSNHLALFMAICQEHHSKVQGQRSEEMLGRLNDLHSIQNRVRERIDNDNVDQAEESEFRQHVRDVTGHDTESSFLLKGRIRYRDNVSISPNGLNFDVYKGQMVDGETVAIKLYREKIVNDGKSLTFVRRMMRQVGLWTSFQHPSILPCYGIGMQITKASEGLSRYDKFQFYLVSPFLRCGDAVQFIDQRRRDNAYVDILRIIRQVATGIQYLHNREQPCVHASVRGENVLIKDDGTACINGFGLTKVLPESTKRIEVTEPKLRWRWMAPESFMTPPMLKPSCDVWSWAMTALELISGKEPYYNVKPEWDIPVMIKAGTAPDESDYPAFRQYSPQPDMMWALLQRCWNVKEDDRPTISQVINELDLIEKAQIEEQAQQVHQWN